MNLSLFQIANYTLILILVILFIRYIWIEYFSRDTKPVEWTHAVHNGQITPLLKGLKRNYSDKVRFYNWWIQVERLKREQVPGVFVELGVYKGESARILHHLDPSRPFHLFDTFTGFTDKDLVEETGEAATYTADNFADTDVAVVLKKINGNDNIILHKGYFPATMTDPGGPIALVNMDADLYNPTKAGLECFYPLLSPGGVIMIHDYNYKWPGVLKAVDDFIKTIPEQMTLIPDINGTAVIIRNK
jgi:O-methyltransferase